MKTLVFDRRNLNHRNGKRVIYYNGEKDQTLLGSELPTCCDGLPWSTRLAGQGTGPS